MKRKLVNLLLALTLALNPVAVLASGFHELSTWLQAPVEAGCQPSQNLAKTTGDSLVENTACDLPCCAEMDCTGQDHCVLYHFSAVVLINPVSIFHLTPYRIQSEVTHRVPELCLPPDNPPPIQV